MCCLAEHAAEMIALGDQIGLVVEDRRMAGVGDEIGEVGPRRQVPGEWRGGVERDDHRPGLELVVDAGRDLADMGVGNGEDDDFGAVERRVGGERSRCQGRSSAAPRRAARHFDMPDLEARALEVAREAIAHFSARAEQCDRRHRILPRWVKGVACLV